MTGSILSLIGKKYSYEILKALTGAENTRFKDLELACPIEKMRTQRLKELETAGLVEHSVKLLGRRPILVYDASEKGRKIAELLGKILKS